MEEAMRQHNIEENCKQLIDELMPQIKTMEQTLLVLTIEILLNIQQAELRLRKVL